MFLVRKRFSINADTSFECYVFVVKRDDGQDEFWFKGRDVAEFLEHTKPVDAIIQMTFRRVGGKSGLS